MMHSTFSRLFAGTSAAALVSAGLALGGPAHAATAQPMFSFTNGWRVDQHVRELADVNGDGRADIVGFGAPGTFVAYGQADGTFTAPALKLRNFGSAQGWSNARHLRTVVDVDGDGREDFLGFGNAGVYVSYAQPDGTFTPATLEIGDFGYHQGWRVDQHPREVTDVNSDGTADVVGFGYSGVHVSTGQLGGEFTAPAKWSEDYGYNRGWRVERHLRTLGDVDGDGFEDVVGFDDAGVYVSSNIHHTAFDYPVLKIANFGYESGWDVEEDVREVVDVNHDGRADIIGFGYFGVAESYGPSFIPMGFNIHEFGTLQGWRGERHLRTLADVNGDGFLDLVGFGNAGVHVAHGRVNNPLDTPPDSSFEAPFLKVGEFGVSDGWSEDRYPRLLGDVNGDGREDVVGFGYSATYVELF